MDRLKTRLTVRRPVGFAHISAVFALVLAVFTLLFALPAAGRAAVVLTSSIPPIGKGVDITELAGVGVTGRYSFQLGYYHQVITKFFDVDDKLQNLTLNQQIVLESMPFSFLVRPGRGWTLGFSGTIMNDYERNLSLLNLVDGATLLGTPLPVGQVTRFNWNGDGMGDLTVNVRKKLEISPMTTALELYLNAGLPTAEDQPGHAFDYPTGQGNVRYTLGSTLSYRLNRWTAALTLGYLLNRPFRRDDGAGSTELYQPGDGWDFDLSALYQPTRSTGFNFILGGFKRYDERINSRANQNTGYYRIDFKPTMIFSSGSWGITFQVAWPVWGSNILAPRTLLTRCEYRW